MVHPHFIKLHERIEQRLPEPPDWLYGALGCPHSDVMFICENPSEKGVQDAGRKYGHLGFEAQWRHKVFRKVLVKCKLKDGGCDAPGGWRCYITNFIKQMDKVSEWRKKPATEKKDIAESWLDVLKWEISQVEPQIVFCVGRNVWEYVGFFQSEGLLFVPNAHRIWHYSAPGGDQVPEKMIAGIREGLARANP